ncbi:MAG TPA: GxxExxY protein [Tepidisphaeraceae bacterium]|jgi:GxxExxY protein|nr:GxxExxY protein [Tepidisphaeraceae bacterium]
MDTDEERLNRLTETIIGCAFRVHNVLGCGFAEKVYENALIHEIRKAGLVVAQQVPIEVWYDGVLVGKYFADVVVEGSVLVETKAVKNFDDAHTAQCLNYLAATQIPLCLLLNFSRKVEIKRLRGPNRA